MQQPDWKRRFVTSTRGRIVDLLRRSDRTVNELAEALALVDNTVRSHLATLEQEGLVEQSGSRPGLRRPHTLYRLTPAGEQLFTESCDPVLSGLLATLIAQLTPERLDDFLQQAGHHMARIYKVGSENSQEESIEKALEVLGQLGGLVEVHRQNGSLIVKGNRCPFAPIVAKYPQVCRVAETLLADLAGVPVREHCQREPSPQCYFEIFPARANLSTTAT